MRPRENASITRSPASQGAGFLLCLALILRVGCGAVAADEALVNPRVLHEFELHYPQTRWGESIFVLGDLPELGAGRMEHAVKLEPSSFPSWKLTAALPAGATVRYRYALRSDAAEKLGDPANGVFVSELQQVTLPEASGPPCHRLVSIAAPTPFTEVVVRDSLGRVRAREPLGAAGARVVARGLPFRHGDELELTGSGRSRRLRTQAQSLYLSADLTQGRWFPGDAPLSASRVEVHEGFGSAHLEGKRAVRVYLPRGYDQQEGRRYPVLYLQDGQNVFSPGGPFGCWDVEKTLDRLIGSGEIPELICVGVDNTRRRMLEYLPPYSTLEGSKGIGDDYARFLLDEVAPFVDRKYRTISDRQQRLVGGSSLGGLISAYVAWHHPAFASRYLCLSPSFWIDDIVLLFDQQPARPVRFYLDSGDRGKSNDAVTQTLTARDCLLQGGKYVYLDGLFHRIAHGQEHNETAWRSRFGSALVTLFDGADLAVRDGDVNGDARTDERDLALLRSGRLTWMEAARADLDGSGGVDARDRSLLEEITK